MSELDREPQISTDGKGNWVAVWQSDNSLEGTIGLDFDILVSYSQNNGASWSDATALNSTAGIDSIDDLQPQIATDGDGNWITVWYTSISDHKVFISKSSDNGKNWSQASVLNTNVSGHDESVIYTRPIIGVDSNGHWVISSLLNSQQKILIYRSNDSGIHWQSTVLNTEGLSSNDYLQMSADNQGNWIMVWTASHPIKSGTGTWVSHSDDNGASWSEPVVLNNNSADDKLIDRVPQIKNDGAGKWIVVLESGGQGYFLQEVYSQRYILVFYSYDNGENWSEATQIVSDKLLNTNPKIVTDRNGNWVLFWEYIDELNHPVYHDTDIFISRSMDNGTSWTEPKPYHNNIEGHEYWLQIETDGSGNWISIWGSSDPLEDTIGSDFDIVVSSSQDNASTWSVPVALNHYAAMDSNPGDGWNVAIESDGKGHWIAVWESDASLAYTISNDNDIFISHSYDNGKSWAKPIAINGVDDSLSDSAPDISTDGKGNWVIIWQAFDYEFLFGRDLDIFYAYSADDGQSWSTSKLLNTNAKLDNREDISAQIANDGHGNWVVVWILKETVDADKDILFAYSNDNGVSWSDPASLDWGNQHKAYEYSAPHIHSPGTDSGNWLAVWSARESQSDPFVTYVSESNNKGKNWSEPKLLTQFGGYSPHFDYGNNGQWAMTWESGNDIFFTESKDNGANWLSPTVLYSGEGNFRPRIATDHQGNWIVTWISTDTMNRSIGNDTDILYTRAIALPEVPVIESIIPGHGQATIAFSTPNYLTIPDDISYTLQCGDDSVTGIASPLLMSGLNNGWTYPCNLTAANRNGTSGESDSMLVTPIESSHILTIEPAISLDEHTINQMEHLDGIDDISSSIQITQNTDNFLLLQTDDLLFNLRPIAIAPNDKAIPPGIKVSKHGNILLHTTEQEIITMYPEPAQIQSLVQDLYHSGFTLQQESLGIIKVSSLQDEVTEQPFQYVVRAALHSEITDEKQALGIFFNPAELPTNQCYYEHLFRLGSELYKQRYYPAIANWTALYAYLETIGEASLDIQGVLTLKIGDYIYRAIPDYKVYQGQSVNTNIQLIQTDDRNNDGLNDFQINYQNGEQQTLYLLSITPTE